MDDYIIYIYSYCFSLLIACYGVTSPTPDQWLCARCSNNVLEAECCLCALRGGALKPTTDNR